MVETGLVDISEGQAPAKLFAAKALLMGESQGKADLDQSVTH
jgi:hypothetical protein